MQKIKIIGLCIIILIVLSGCDKIMTKAESDALQTNLNTCESNLDIFGCDMLLFCDRECNKLGLNTPIIACHSVYTNHIIAKCK